MNHSFQGLAVPIPGSDVSCQDALSGAGVEIPQYCDQAHHSCAVSKLDDAVVVKSGYTVLYVQ